MKRFLISIILILTIFLFSCKHAYDVVPIGSQANWSGSTLQVTYSASDYMFEVTNTTQNLDITLPDPNGGSYDLYVVQINNSDNTVAAVDNQYVVGAGFRSARNASDEVGEFLMASELDKIDFPDIPEDDGSVKRVHFVDNFVPPPFYGNSPEKNSSVPRSVSASYFAPVNPSYASSDVGTTKDIFVDVKNPSNPESISLFNKKTATLEAVGAYCYVWVVNSYFGSGFNQIEKNAAENIQKKFDGFYEYVRHVFGNEADFIITGPNSTSNMSDTKVNIVVYDILEDSKSTQTGGILGYFSSKDYYAASYGRSDSNEGKYFYVDSYFAKEFPGETISTLAHEFQHMISFNVKTLRQRVNSYNGYNEMLSMLCEDMLQTKMNVSDLNSPKGRFINFLSSYYRYGIFDEPDDAYFYAVTYMFGAFLARNYGGAKLVSEMAKNGYGNAASITAALKTLGYNQTFEDVLKEYAKALVLPNQTDKTFNKDADTYDDFKYGSDNYKFPMTKFNIFDFKNSSGTSHSMLPAVHRNLITNKSSRKDLHGKGIIPYYVGYTTSGGKLRLTFSSPVKSNAKVYVLVGKK